MAVATVSCHSNSCPAAWLVGPNPRPSAKAVTLSSWAWWAPRPHSLALQPQATVLSSPQVLAERQRARRLRRARPPSTAWLRATRERMRRQTRTGAVLRWVEVLCSGPEQPASVWRGIKGGLLFGPEPLPCASVHGRLSSWSNRALQGPVVSRGDTGCWSQR